MLFAVGTDMYPRQSNEIALVYIHGFEMHFERYRSAGIAVSGNVADMCAAGGYR